MTKIILIAVAALAYSGFVFASGYNVRDGIAKRDAAIARLAFERTVREANEAYADQRIKDDKEMEDLRQKASTAPADPTIAIKRETAKRIGAIR